MANDVAIVGDALVTIINNASLGFAVTAERVYESCDLLPGLSSVKVDIWPTGGKSKTRQDRSQLKVSQGYAVSVRKRMTGVELVDDKIDLATLDAWMAFIDELEDVAWNGRFSSLGARVESVEIANEYDVEFLKTHSLFAAAMIINVAWYREP